MATTEANDQRSTAVRPRTVHLGIDADGAHHIYRTQTETVHVVQPATGRTHVEALGRRPVEDWMAYVDDRRGWSDKRYGLGIAGAVERAVEER